MRSQLRGSSLLDDDQVVMHIHCLEIDAHKSTYLDQADAKQMTSVLQALSRQTELTEFQCFDSIRSNPGNAVLLKIQWQLLASPIVTVKLHFCHVTVPEVVVAMVTPLAQSSTLQELALESLPQDLDSAPVFQAINAFPNHTIRPLR